MILERGFDKIYLLIKLSMIYFVLLICGFVILGFGPANATMINLYGQHKQEVEKYRIGESFLLFKASFLSANLFFLSLILLSGGLSYILYLLVQMKPSIWLLSAMLGHLLLLAYLVAIYGVYLKLQVYFDFTYLIALKLAAISVFLDWRAMVKWLLGTGICFILALKLPLLITIFIPIIWLSFTFDILDPIYQLVADRGMSE